MASIFAGEEPLGKVIRYDKTKNRVEITRPHVIEEYNKHMGGVDLLDSIIHWPQKLRKERIFMSERKYANIKLFRTFLSTLGSIPIRILCPDDLFQADHELQHLHFLALSARRRRTTTVPQLVADHFQASGRRISRYYGAKSSSNAGLYARRPVVCVPLNGRQRRNRLCWAREHVSWTQQQWASVLFTDESPDLQWRVIQGVY
ncbi:HTH_Tnp_Tc3_2 domain-containing protein [Trichonephila clavipes]|nr:HTH_Tnp_Tc3_2 domain-containing protein [Trichonephila clavipes]